MHIYSAIVEVFLPSKENVLERLIFNSNLISENSKFNFFLNYYFRVKHLN